MKMKPHNWVYLAIILALLYHGALMPFTYGQTYDAYIHMFFANNYNESWFDPWETRWYTGFAVTAYPPGSHQIMGLLIHLMDMRVAFVLTFLFGIVVLVIGVYRFCQIWVPALPSAYAALACVFMTGIVETVHIFGQLPTILSISIFLNAIPFIYDWIRIGRMKNFILALIFTGGATAVHHVTPLFGTVFFVAPAGLAAWIASIKPQGNSLKDIVIAPIRGICLGACMLMLIISIVFPYWYWSITDPITQVSIPHGSRENFIAKPNLGLMFFVIPWGFLFFILPYAAIKTIHIRYWPLGISMFFAFFLGTGGTTPYPKMILGPAFDILTLDRFTFWSTLLILPFAGLCIQSVTTGRLHQIFTAAFGQLATRLGLAFILLAYVAASVSVAIIPKFRPTQPNFIDPAPIVKFMNEDSHFKWRYLTLGFGDQFAYHSALIDAQSVDGNYHSARRLPSLTNYSVERLENSKYSGVPGLASLNQFLTNADQFHLKFIFSNDEYYDPLLHYTGWNPVTRLQNGIMVWEKPNIAPLPDRVPRREIAAYQRYMWGTLPIGAVSLMALALIYLALRGELISRSLSMPTWTPSYYQYGPGRLSIYTARAVLVMILAPLSLFISSRWLMDAPAPPPSQAVHAYYGHLDFREYAQAFDYVRLKEGESYQDFLRVLLKTGGLVPSYGKLTDVVILDSQDIEPGQTEVRAELTFLTAMGYLKQSITHMLYKNALGDWQLKFDAKSRDFTPAMLTRNATVGFRDMSARHINNPDVDLVSKMSPPTANVYDAKLLHEDGRFFVAGYIQNTSSMPGCYQMKSRLLSEAGATLLTQAAGTIGAHRLGPGESTAFKIAFEGFLKISDMDYGAGYDPDQFSLPEFDSLPTGATLDIESTLCQPELYRDIHLSEFQHTPNGLYVTVTNAGHDIMTTLQIKLMDRKIQQTGDWHTQSPKDAQRIFSHFMQYNLNPGEQRRIFIAYPDSWPDVLASLSETRVNQNPQTIDRALPSHSLRVDDRDIFISYDAMIYDQTR